MVNLRRDQSSAPMIATFFACPGAGTRKLVLAKAGIHPTLRPSTGQIGMRQRFTFISVEQHNIARLGLLTAELQSQADAVDRVGVLALGVARALRAAGPAAAAPRLPAPEITRALPGDHRATRTAALARPRERG